jgi:anion-transporting  ArsA/GET3 family ATPase
MEEARQLFRDKERTEFIIVTIPTVMAVAESERLAASLQTEQVPVKRIVMNQLVCTSPAYLLSRRPLVASFGGTIVTVSLPACHVSLGVFPSAYIRYCMLPGSV